MKAEERKELQTNVLADTLGRTMQRVQHSSRNTLIFWLLILLITFVAYLLVVRYFATRSNDESMRWMSLYDGAGHRLDRLSTQDGQTTAGKAARLQLAWLELWEKGIKRLAMDPKVSEQLERSGKLYKALAEECKGDPVFEPEALFGAAVVEETMALFDKSRLDSAIDMYSALAKNHSKSAHGQLAKQWLERLEDDAQRREVSGVYDDLRRSFRIPEKLFK